MFDEHNLPMDENLMNCLNSAGNLSSAENILQIESNIEAEIFMNGYKQPSVVSFEPR